MTINLNTKYIHIMQLSFDLGSISLSIYEYQKITFEPKWIADPVVKARDENEFQLKLMRY